MSERVGKAIEVANDTAEAEKGGTLALEKAIKSYEPWWQKAMPAGREAAQLVRDAVHCLRVTPDLARCDQRSVLGGLMTCAQLGLRPGVANLGHAWLVPLNDKNSPTGKSASLWLGYRGMVELAYRNTRVETIVGRAVYANETYRSAYAPPAVTHEPVQWGEQTGPVVGYYVAAYMARGGLIFGQMDEQEAEQIRQDAIRGKKPDNPWVKHPEPMKIKTVLRRKVWKWLPLSLDGEAVEAVDGAVRLDASPDRRPEDVSVVIDSTAEEADQSDGEGLE